MVQTQCVVTRACNHCYSLLPLISFFLQVVEDGYEFFARRQLVTLFSAPNYCGDYDNAGGMMTVNEDLMCSFQVCKTALYCRQPLFCLVARSVDVK